MAATKPPLVVVIAAMTQVATESTSVRRGATLCSMILQIAPGECPAAAG
jgi:hypothetical protein